MSRDLDTLHPRVKSLVLQFLELCHKTGLDPIITATFRSNKEQDDLYAQGRTKPGKIVTNAKGGYSYHNYGLAVDVAARINGDISWNEKDYIPFGKIAKAVGLEWGGDWPNPDYPHLQYTFGLTIDQLLTGTKIPE